MNTQQFDIVIVGGGIVGATLAALLVKQTSQLKIAIIEPAVLDAAIDDPDRSDDPSKKTSNRPMSRQNSESALEIKSLESFEARVSAVSLASENVLKVCDAWLDIAKHRVSPYATMEVWDDDGTGSVFFDAAQIEQDHLGCIVENNSIIRALWQQLELATSVTVFAGYRAVRQQRAENGSWQIELSSLSASLESSAQISCKLLVAADGANSRIREQQNFVMRAWDYGHTGIVATIKTEKSHQGCARQNFLSSGPLALLPLVLHDSDTQQQYCSIVWSCTKERAQHLISLSEEEFCTELEHASERRLGSVLAISRRYSFPLKQQHASRYIASGLVLVGDAAHTIHPLAGQGVNLGILDAAILAEEVSKASQAGAPIEGQAVLRRYERRRKGHNLSMMAAMESFKRLFAGQALPLRLLRNVGMKAFNDNAWVKKRVLARAMGLDGDLPVAALSPNERLDPVSD